MSQPRWKLVANLGDVNPIEHGGFFVYVDTSKQYYEPEIEVLETSDTPEGWTLSRLTIAQSPENEWWWKKLKNVASYCGADLADLAADLIVGDLLDKARAYRDIISYFGTYEFDQNAQIFTKRSRLPRRIRRSRLT